MRAIFERYSYRGLYEQTPIPREHLRTIMEAGLAAPSGCNTQTTGLIGLDDPALLRAVAEPMGKSYCSSAPAAVCVLTRRISSYGGACFNVQDYAAAIENMLIAITELGYASCWVEGYVTSDPEISEAMKKLLGVPENYELVAFLPIGVPVGEGPRAKKKPFEERAWFNGFGNRQI